MTRYYLIFLLCTSITCEHNILSRCLLEITQKYFQSASIAMLTIEDNYDIQYKTCTQRPVSQIKSKEIDFTRDESFDSVSSAIWSFITTKRKGYNITVPHNNASADLLAQENATEINMEDENTSNMAEEQFDDVENETKLRPWQWELIYYFRKQQLHTFYIDNVILNSCYRSGFKEDMIFPADVTIIFDNTDSGVVLFDCYCPQMEGYFKGNGRGVLVMPDRNTTFNDIERLLNNMFHFMYFVNINVLLVKEDYIEIYGYFPYRCYNKTSILDVWNDGFLHGSNLYPEKINNRLECGTISALWGEDYYYYKGNPFFYVIMYPIFNKLNLKYFTNTFDDVFDYDIHMYATPRFSKRYSSILPLYMYDKYVLFVADPEKGPNLLSFLKPFDLPS